TLGLPSSSRDGAVTSVSKPPTWAGASQARIEEWEPHGLAIAASVLRQNPQRPVDKRRAFIEACPKLIAAPPRHGPTHAMICLIGSAPSTPMSFWSRPL